MNNKPLIEFRPEDKKNRKGIFFVLSGPSGVGKNTLLGHVLQRMQGIYYIPSLTTRQMRPGESQGNPYVFVTVPEFKTMIEEGQLLEWKKVHGNNYYGTHLSTILYAMEHGYDIVTDMDVLGCADVVDRFKDNVVTIFISPPSPSALLQRLLDRDQDPESAKQRLARMEMEMAQMEKYDLVIVNDDMEVAVNELIASMSQVIKAGKKPKNNG